MNETLTIAKFKTCFGCNYQAETTETKCLNCRKPLQDVSTIRVLGGLMMFLGTLLFGGMVALMLWINNAMTNPASTIKFDKNAPQNDLIFPILGMVAFFGVAAMLTGILQVLTGKRNKMMIGLMLGLAAVLFILANVIPMIF